VLAWRAVDAAEALAELKELSPQLRAIVLVRRDGTIEASTEEAGRAASIGAAAARLVERAEALGRDLGRDDVAQLQAATAEGSVFAVVDERRVAVAITDADPTVGLVFYDLKTLLRRLGTADVGA
jgi:predicted regulator of Ras-like GTPase activity (Roadblock/LC7/MglB family)